MTTVKVDQGVATDPPTLTIEKDVQTELKEFEAEKDKGSENMTFHNAAMLTFREARKDSVDVVTQTEVTAVAHQGNLNLELFDAQEKLPTSFQT